MTAALAARKAEFRQLCRDSGLTQQEIATVLGVSRRILQYWLSDGRHEPPPMAVMALRWLAVL
jgi:DNA-binding transcriptional regulator YiaG